MFRWLGETYGPHGNRAQMFVEQPIDAALGEPLEQYQWRGSRSKPSRSVPGSGTIQLTACERSRVINPMRAPGLFDARPPNEAPRAISGGVYARACLASNRRMRSD
jgi:hypothetical protein